MVGVYLGLPADVAATVPRRPALRHSWIRPSPSPSLQDTPDAPPPDTSCSSSLPAAAAAASLRAQDPPSPGGASAPPASLRPTSVVLTTYGPPDGATPELRGLPGQVSRAKAFFESRSVEPEGTEPPPPPPEEELSATAVTYRVRNPLRWSPRPRLRRLHRNTVSSFPPWPPARDAERAHRPAEAPGPIRGLPKEGGADALEMGRVEPVSLVQRRREGPVEGPPEGGVADEVGVVVSGSTSSGRAGGGGVTVTGADAVSVSPVSTGSGEGGGGGGGGGGAGALAKDSSSSSSSSSGAGLSMGRDADRAGPPQSRLDPASFVSGECQGSAVGGHERGAMVVPGEGRVQATPRVVSACIKSFRDIPEELLDSLQESSVDPVVLLGPAAPSVPSPPPTPTPTPTPAPRSDWRTMREGRRALLTGEVSDADTEEEEEGSEGDLGGVASTSDYHTSDGRGSSLSGASDDPQRRGDHFFCGSQKGGCHAHDVEEPSYECYNAHVSAPTAAIRNNFRGFCSTMLGAALGPDEPPARPPPPQEFRSRTPSPDDHLLLQAQLEEELRAAGVYFRRPGSPPRLLAKGLAPRRTQETEAVTEALDELDASLAGLGASSSESSPARSHASSVVERRQSGAEPAAARGGDDDDDDAAHGRRDSLHQPPACGDAATENPNLIEEVYVDTRAAAPPNYSSVSMHAYYPGVQYAAALDVPARPAGAGRSRGGAAPPADSDSGHESGATSPCGTLTRRGAPAPSSPSSALHSRTSSLQSCRGVGVLEGEVGVAVVGDSDARAGAAAGGALLEPRPPTHFVVVAIDFGTTYSGYAFSFTRDPDSVHMMKKWEGGDPGVQNQKTPTIVLLTPERKFHSLGFTARDTYHDLDPKDAKRWLYFDKFKMALHADQNLSRETLLEAANGRKVPALEIFTHALRYFRDHALRELSDQAGVAVLEEDVRWVITVPAIWSHPAKQFMRTAAHQAGMGSASRPEQLLIALEPEAAAIYCRRLRRHQLLPERPPELRPPKHCPSKDCLSPSDSPVPALPELDREELVSLPYRSRETVADWLQEDTVYAVVDCGGGTVDITVHQMTDRLTGHLKELHKATGGPYGSTGVDAEFERFLETVFSPDFVATFRQQRPAAYVDLMIAFESRKRNASPFRSNPLNIALPFSFIDLFRKFKGKDVEWAIKKHQQLGVRWSAQGMLRVEQDTMRQLFLPTLSNITQAIESVLSAPEVGPLQYMFLVGGFAESELLQKHIRDTFGHRVNVIIPQGMGLAILRGAVQFGLDPGVVTVRRSRLTYGVGVLNRFRRGVHPGEKRVVAAGSEWCADVLDRFVAVDESVAVGDVVVRSYTPATPTQNTVILHLYATQCHDAKFVTEEGVERVGTLHLDLGSASHLLHPQNKARREITVHMKFGDTEVKASAVDHLTGQCVKATIDFLTL